MKKVSGKFKEERNETKSQAEPRLGSPPSGLEPPGNLGHSLGELEDNFSGDGKRRFR